MAADRTGATMIEYALLCALIAMVVVGALGEIGQQFDAILQAAADGFERDDRG